jgi:hypothetical protein
MHLQYKLRELILTTAEEEKYRFQRLALLALPEQIPMPLLIVTVALPQH